MSLRSRLTAITAAAAVLAIAPVATAAAVPGPLTLPGSSPDACLSGLTDPGPFGPSGPYGPGGPWGANGPLNGHPNPLGNTAECGGLIAFVLRGGTVSSYVNANLASVGITSPSAGQ